MSWNAGSAFGIAGKQQNVCISLVSRNLDLFYFYIEYRLLRMNGGT